MLRQPVMINILKVLVKKENNVDKLMKKLIRGLKSTGKSQMEVGFRGTNS